jgi:hypothetical protein
MRGKNTIAKSTNNVNTNGGRLLSVNDSDSNALAPGNLQEISKKKSFGPNLIDTNTASAMKRIVDNDSPMSVAIPRRVEVISSQKSERLLWEMMFCPGSGNWRSGSIMKDISVNSTQLLVSHPIHIVNGLGSMFVDDVDT